MEYQILVLLSNIFFIAAGYYLGKDAGVKSTIKAMDQVFNRIVDDIEEKDSYK